MERFTTLQQRMHSTGIQALVVEPGPALLALTGVRWGRSERTFAFILPAKGEPAYVLPGFEEMRARELIQDGSDIRIWQEDESPFGRIAEVLRNRGIVGGRVAVEDSVRFFIFDGIRGAAPKLELVSAKTLLR
jgi:Xaa-Pro dipeptidase